ncbi:MAG: RrF2 family transcriptional regulator [Phycisphaerales bacterium]
MRLSQFTDYALRVLLYIEAAGPHGADSPPVATGDIAKAYGISKHHLLKVVAALAEHGYIESVRGRSGGIRPLKPASKIRIGELVRPRTYGYRRVPRPRDQHLPDRAGLQTRPRPLAPAEAFVEELDTLTLADLVPRRSQYAQILIDGTPPQR